MPLPYVVIIIKKVEDIRKIYNEISFRFEDFGVQCLYDTVQKGIPQFLKWYDIKFCPQDTILTLDYPLLIDCSSSTGADVVYNYIRAIQTEQIFLGRFDRNYVIAVLEKYNAGYRDMIENICSIVLTNIIGHIAIQKPLHDIDFYENDMNMLEYLCYETKNIAVRIYTANQHEQLSKVFVS